MAVRGRYVARIIVLVAYTALDQSSILAFLPVNLPPCKFTSYGWYRCIAIRNSGA
jgi:hypothetical protein